MPKKNTSTGGQPVSTKKSIPIPRKRKALAIKEQQPKVGEMTGFQQGALGFGNSGLTQEVRGFTRLTSRSTYHLYRKMMDDPTLQLAYHTATAQTKATKWIYRDKNAPSGALEFIEETLGVLKDFIVNLCCQSLIYGWSPSEKVFEEKNGDIILSKLKPLLWDITEVYVTKNGNFAGLAADNNNTDLDPSKCFVYTNDPAPDNPYYGRARLENAKQDWNTYRGKSGLVDRQGQYIRKVASVIPCIMYPQGELPDQNGLLQSNTLHAEQILNDLSTGFGVCIPKTFMADAADLMRSGATFKEILNWTVDILEVKVDHGASFVGQRRAVESLLCRAFLVPERAIIEGNYGTKAESEAQYDVALQIQQQLTRDIVRYVNWYTVDQLVVLNYGESARGTVYIEPEPLYNENLETLMKIITSFGPQNIPILSQWIDMVEILDELGIPMNSEMMMPAELPMIEPVVPAPARAPVEDQSAKDNSDQEGS